MSASTYFPTAEDIVRTAEPAMLPEVIGELGRLTALAQQRLFTPPAPPAPEEGADLPAMLLPIDVAKDLNLRVLRGARKGEYSTKAAYDLANRRSTPDLPQMPAERIGHRWRISRAAYLDWRKAYRNAAQRA